MRASWLADVLADAGLKVKPFPGWETRGSTDFVPRGVILHHTVTLPSTPDKTVDKVLALTGSSSVPAPLCNYSTNRDGTVSVIAAGRANHAGIGEWLTVKAVAGVNGNEGNRQFFGDEMKNLGSKEPWPTVQLVSARVAAAAILNHLNADEGWMCGHKEWAPGRKVDPHSLNMDTERLLVGGLLPKDSNMYAACREGDSGQAVEAWQRVMQRITGFAPPAWGQFGPETTAELQSLTGPGDSIGPGEGAHLLELLGAAGEGVSEERVKALINSSSVKAP